MAGRINNTKNPYSSDYDAMEEEFYDADNSYSVGQGAQIKYQRKKNGPGDESPGVRLHISNVPISLTEAGLMHIFSQNEGKPEKPFVAKHRINQDPNSPTWGFIEFRTHSEAQDAILAVNKKPPHFLKVTFAKSTEIRNDDRNTRDDSDRCSVMNSKKRTNASLPRGRGQLPPMQGKPPSSFRAQRAIEEPYFDAASINRGYSQDNFSMHDDNYEVNASNAVHSSYADGIYDDGQRKMSMGRGVFISKPEPPRGGNMRECYKYEEINDDLDNKLAAYIGKKYKELTCEENMKLSSEARLALPFKLGSCTYCSRPSIYVCSRCKAWYCCNSCRVDDYADHQKDCYPRSVDTISANGNVNFNNKPDEFANKLEVPIVSKSSVQNRLLKETQNLSEDRTPRRSYDNGQQERNPRLSQDGYQQGPNDYNDNSTPRSRTSRGPDEDFPRDRNSRGYDDSPRDRNMRSPQDTNGYSDNRGFDNSREQNQRGGRRDGQRDQRGDINQRGNRGGQNDNKERGGGGGGRGGGGRTGGGGGGGPNRNGVRNDRRTPTTKSTDNEVYVRPPLSPPASISGKQEPNRSQISEPVGVPPIPMNQFTEITVGGLGKIKNEFWAYSKNDYKTQGEMMQALNKHCKNVSPITSRLEKGTKVCAPFCDDWYRAEVINVEQAKVTVFFIDFGNECTVDKQQLKPLPQDLADKPVLVHKYVLDESPTNPELSEDTPLNVKPVRQDKGRWVVHVEGVTYSDQPYQEVTILVTEMSDEYWVHKSTDTCLLGEMASDLGEHKDLKIEPSLNEIYVHFHDLTWCRAKVVSLNPLTVFYIDYGNGQVVKKSELHPLPPKYAEVPPMAIKIKLIEGSSPSCYNLTENSLLYIKPIDKKADGTLLCEAKCSHGGPTNDEVSCKHLVYTLNPSKSPHLHVEKAMNEDFLTGCIIPDGDVPSYLKVSKILAEQVNKDEIVRVKPGMMVACLWDSEWHRGYVMLIRREDPVVALTDRGRVVIPEKVCRLPETMNKVPECGVRAIFKNPIPSDINLTGKVFKIIEPRIDGDKVFVVIKNLGEAVLIPWEPAIEEAGLSCTKISSGTKVVLSSYVSPSAVYIQSNHPQDIIIRSELIQDVAAHSLKCEPLKRKPYINEFLAVRFAEDGNYYRAQVFKKQENKYKVIFVDYGNTELVTIEDMKPLSDSLKLVPCCAVKVGLKGVPNIPFNAECMKYLNELAANLMELFLTYDNDLREVTLELGEGEVINRVLARLLSPSWEKKDFDPIKTPVFMRNDLNYEPWDVGTKFEIAVVRAMSLNKIAALRTGSNLLNHIEHTLTPRITKYCESFPNEVYNPRANEVCLAKFHEDGLWYRALCQKSYLHNASDLIYLDYGNSGEVLHRCIRKMVPEFMNAPIALKICSIYGMPKSVDESIEKSIIDYLSSAKFDAEVIEESDDTILWIPSLATFASKLGVTLKSPHSR